MDPKPFIPSPDHGPQIRRVPFEIIAWYYDTMPLRLPEDQMSQDIDNSEVSRRDMLLGMIQKEYPAYHPLISIARIAHHHDADLKVQLECHKTIAKYVEPELKTVEVKGEITGRHRVSVSLFEPSGAEFHPVDAGLKPAIEGQATRVLAAGDNFDPDPAIVDRVVSHGW